MAAEKFDIAKVNRNRCVGWVSEGFTLPDGEKVKKGGKGVYTSDLMDDNGNVLPNLCTHYGIDPTTVKQLTVADIPAEYSQGVKQAVAKLAEEWSKSYISADDVIWDLVISARMQEAANESVKQHRPVTDKAIDRAISSMMKVTGKTEAEVRQLLGIVK